MPRFVGLPTEPKKKITGANLLTRNLCLVILVGGGASMICAHGCLTKLRALSKQNWYAGGSGVQGAVHKVRHARGGGGPRRCDSLTEGGGQEHVTSRLYTFLSYETWNLKCIMFNFLL